ncbi:MAG: GHMP kinase [Thaumarchaeota archaeon]|jgi:pantoate kinase|nr:GHMP kinase [Nitrososphaerota archaeon]MBT3743950.1 GHMP kinase [Nitrososphaerota archaeon]MBT4057678.1 GHMP kinase [Nitrososphaerota archaeon]MBT4510469.1 GHMP kinase [Nitrososphaerota archaeon]MBT4676211.1 GHMP kinase [Nitrososphaerota archaeon]
MMATAFCPAHITGFFKAELDKEDSKQLGSLGAGFSIQKGVKTTVAVRDKTKHDISDFTIKVDGFESGDMRVSELVLNRFSVKGKFIDVTHDIDVPVGYGFGCSAAVALSLSIALNDALDCKLTKIQVAQIAHNIEIECRTGLGDVLASYHGGFEIRVKPGAPGVGQVKKIDLSEKRDVIIICFNPISTKKFLKEKISSINGLGGKMVKKLIESNDTEEFQDMSIKFAKYVNVVTPKMNQVINLLHKNGIKCGVALFGETVFSLVTKDEKNKVKALLKQFDDGLIITSKIDNSGARLQ